jgi:hypothetical protein
VLLNKGAAAQTVLLRAPRGATATLTRLLASSIRTRSAVALAASRSTAPGRWQGRRRTGRVRWSGGGYRVTLPAFSGALLTAGP